MSDGQVARTTQDLIGRFTPTPLWIEVSAMRRTIRLETNSPAVLQLMSRVFEDRGDDAPGNTAFAPPIFTWRLVSDPAATWKSAQSEVAMVSDDGLRYASFGQSSFVAVDLASRGAVAFMPEQLTRDEAGFKETMLAALFAMTADALGLTLFRGSLVRRGAKALLIVGSQPGDRRDFWCFAEESDLEFVAGETTLLELGPDGLRAWAGFRPDRPAALVCCVFAEREPADAPRLDPLPLAALAERLRPHLLFRHERSFATQRDAVLGALARLPAYSFAYGKSAETAMLLGSLLEDHSARGAKA